MRTSGRRYKLVWSGIDAGPGGIEILVKEEISGNVVQVRRKRDKVMATVLTLGTEVTRIISTYEPQSERPEIEKVCFYDEMASEWDFESSSKIIVSLGDFNKHVGKCAEGFQGVYEGNGIGKRNVEDCESSVRGKYMILQGREKENHQ